MRRDFVPEGRAPDPDLPRHARDYYPGDTAPRGLGQRVRTDFVPEGGLSALPEPERPLTAMIPEPKEAPLLEKDFVPSIPLEPEPEPQFARLPIGTAVGKAADGRAIRITGYDEDGQMMAEVDEEDAVEAGAKGGESEVDEPRRSRAFPEAPEEAPSTQHPAPKKSHKKKPDVGGE